MFARRLLTASRGGGSVIAPPSSIITLTSAPAGGWTQVTEARAVYHNGVTYFAYINGSNGDAEVRSYDGSSVSSATVLHAALSSPGDTHDCPSLIVLPSGKILAAYSAHVGGSMFVRVSTSAEDISAFDSEVTAHSGGTHTYPTVVQRLAETNDPIYVFYRSGSGSSTAMVYIKSSDGGATWASPVTVWDNNDSSYWKIACDGQWRIDFAVSSADPADASSSICHFYADDEDYKTSDGTPMTGQPFGNADATLVYDTADAGPAWPHDLMYDGSGNPLILYGIETGGDSEYRYGRWNGSAWVESTALASAGAGQDVPAYGCHESPTTVILARLISGQFELWRYTRVGDTWDAGTAITSASSDDNIYPARVHAHPSDGFVWLFGTFTDAVDFDLGIKMLA